MLLSITEKLHITNTVDAIKIFLNPPPKKKKKKIFAFDVPFKMRDSTRSTSERRNQSGSDGAVLTRTGSTSTSCAGIKKKNIAFVCRNT